MRAIVLALAMAAGAAAMADHSLLTPKATNLGTGRVRIDSIWSADKAVQMGWIDIGVNPNWDVTIASDRALSSDPRATLDLHYNYVYPFFDKVPGISVGVLDLFDRTARGTAPYLAITWDSSNIGRYNQDIPTEMTLGLWDHGGGFQLYGAAIVPFSGAFRFVVEQDQKQLWTSLEASPVNGFKLRMAFQRGLPRWGATLNLNF